tara:strand:+ start:47 stop:430 length:384 start_codon:yes stop_codon:yes gene_type:complete
MKLSKLSGQGLFRTKIEIGEFLEEEPSAVWLEFREPTNEEFHAWNKATSQDRMLMIMEFCVDSNIEGEDGKPATADVIYRDLLSERSNLYQYVSEEFINWLPLVKRKGLSSDNSPELSSTEVSSLPN